MNTSVFGKVKRRILRYDSPPSISTSTIPATIFLHTRETNCYEPRYKAPCFLKAHITLVRIWISPHLRVPERDGQFSVVKEYRRCCIVEYWDLNLLQVPLRSELLQ